MDGRPPTAAARPKTSMGGTAPRPGSRVQSAAVARSQAARPKTSAQQAPAGHVMARVQSRAGASSRVGGTASRLGTAAPQGRAPTAMARPVTQQGLAGVRAQSRAGTAMGQRQVMDKTYYMGLMRAKINELCKEIDALNKQLDKGHEDRENFLVFEKRAEEAADEIRQLQGKLADCNLLIDRTNMNADLGTIQADVANIKAHNDKVQEEVDSLFADRRDKEEQLKRLESEVEIMKRQNENMINNLDPGVRARYAELHEQAAQLSEDVRLKEQDLKELTQKKSDLEDELAVSPLKQEALVLHEKLAEVQAKRDEIAQQINAEGTPEQQRERLLEKVKKDNEEIAAMQRQTEEVVREKIEQCQEEMRELEEEHQDQAGEKNEKYRELRTKEKQIDEFLETYEQSKAEESERVEKFQKTVLRLLTLISRNWSQIDKTAVVTGMMQEYDIGKIGQNIQSGGGTVQELQETHMQLQEELIQLDEINDKAGEELSTLQNGVQEIQQQIEMFSDLDGLKDSIEHKRQALQVERQALESIVSETRTKAGQIAAEVTQIKANLKENDAYLQVLNLEKKLQYVEQNNFALRETVEARSAETNVGPVKEQVLEMLADYNTSLVALSAANARGASANRAARE